MTAASTSLPWPSRRKLVFQSVFPIEVLQPTPAPGKSDENRFFGRPSSVRGQTRGSGTSTARVLSVSRTHGLKSSRSQQQDRPTRLGDDLAAAPAAAIARHGRSTKSSLSLSSPSNRSQDQIVYDRAWHTVTARIHLPASTTAEDLLGTPNRESQLGSEHEFYEALRLVVNAPKLLPQASRTQDVVSWHLAQVRQHFAQHVLPLLSACTLGDSDDDMMEEDGGAEADVGGGWSYQRHKMVVMITIRTLEAAMRIYMCGLEMLVRGLRNASGAASSDADHVLGRFRRHVYALVSNAATQALVDSLMLVVLRRVEIILGCPVVDERDGTRRESGRPAPPADDDVHARHARSQLLELVERLQDVGLGGERFQMIFAEAMNTTMARFVREAYRGVWTSSKTASSETSLDAQMAKDTISRPPSRPLASSCLISLGYWVENHFARLAFEVQSLIVTPGTTPLSLADVRRFQHVAQYRLAALRTTELFDVVLAWPASSGALDDLRACINHPVSRQHLTDSFNAALKDRLLHAGCSTQQILGTYVAIIRTFHALDSTEVLLSRVVPSFQWYICQRDDAVRILVLGLLTSPASTDADPTPKLSKAEETRPGSLPMSRRTPRPSDSSRLRSHRDQAPQKSTVAVSSTTLELARFLEDPKQNQLGWEDDDLDWSDMSWTPNPLDAGTNYKRSRSEDVVGTLINTLGSPETFIKEFTVILAERLLGEACTSMAQELKVLRLLKQRFGDAALQSCDVMMRDVQDSRRLDHAIHRVQMESHAETTTQYHARILSRLFWPGLDREHFVLPEPVTAIQRHYENGYERLKSGRRLAWMNQMGQARVELELQDRTVTVDCSTTEATVIYAFQANGEDSATTDVASFRRSVDELYTTLQMEEDVLGAALRFWTAKGILRAVSSNTFAVAERLAGVDEVAAAAATTAGSSQANAENTAEPSVAAGRSKLGDKREQERRTLYWQYVRSMLINSSSTMTLAQIVMMMKLMIPDGFSWSHEDLQGFLAQKVADGELEMAGIKYRLVKK